MPLLLALDKRSKGLGLFATPNFCANAETRPATEKEDCAEAYELLVDGLSLIVEVESQEQKVNSRGKLAYSGP